MADEEKNVMEDMPDAAAAQQQDQAEGSPEADREDGQQACCCEEGCDCENEEPDAAQGGADAAAPDGTGGFMKGFGKGGKKKDKKEDAAKEKLNELEDRVKRQMAEFENYRRRTDKEKSAMFETGAKSVLEKILPIVDNFERGLASVPDADKEAPFTEGMNMIYKQLMTELDNMGIKPIEAVGAEFDPALHNAVMQVENEELESGTVAQELLKGYMYRDTVLRHSMVAVVQ